MTEARIVLDGMAQLNRQEVSFELDCCDDDANDENGSLLTLPSIVITALLLLLS